MITYNLHTHRFCHAVCLSSGFSYTAADLTTIPPTFRRRRRAAGDVSSATSHTTSGSSRDTDRQSGEGEDEEHTRGLVAAEQSQMRGPLYDFFVRYS